MKVQHSKSMFPLKPIKPTAFCVSAREPVSRRCVRTSARVCADGGGKKKKNVKTKLFRA